jgi:hypothetical protein
MCILTVNELQLLMSFNNVKSYAFIRKNMTYYQYQINTLYPGWKQGNILHGLIINFHYVTKKTLYEFYKTISHARMLGCIVLKNKYNEYPFDILSNNFSFSLQDKNYEEIKRRLYSKVSLKDTIEF